MEASSSDVDPLTRGTSGRPILLRNYRREFRAGPRSHADTNHSRNESKISRHYRHAGPAAHAVDSPHKTYTVVISEFDDRVGRLLSIPAYGHRVGVRTGRFRDSRPG